MRLGCYWLAVVLCAVAAAPASADPPLDLAGELLPPGAVARMGSQRFRQSTGISELAFMPSGELVTLTPDGSLRFFDRADGRLLRTFSAENEPVQFAKTLSVSPDGLFIATSGSLRDGDGQPIRPSIRVWNAASGSVARTIVWDAPPAAECNQALFSPDSQTIFSASRDGSIRIWELVSGRELLNSKVSEPGLETMALSPDGSFVATAGRRGSMALWAWQTVEAPRRLEGGPNVATSAAFSPDGKLLACAGSDRGGVRVWELATGKLLRSFETSEGHDYCRRIAFSPDGKLLCATSHVSEAIVVWEVATGQELRRLTDKPVKPGWLAISPDSQWIATASNGAGVVRVWSVNTGEPIASPVDALDGPAGRLAFSPDDAILYSAGDDHTVRSWESHTGRQRWVVRHGHWVRGFALSTDGKHIASSSLDDTVRLLDAASGRQIYLLPGHGRVGGWRETAFLRGGKQFLSWGDDMYLRVWDVATGKALVENLLRPSGAQIPEDEEDPETTFGRLDDWRFGLGPAALTPDDKRFVLVYQNSLRVFEISTGREARNLGGQEGRIQTLALSPDGTLALTNEFGKPEAGGVDPRAANHVARLRELHTAMHRADLKLPGQQAGPVAFNAAGRLFAVASSPPPHVGLFDAQTGEPKATLDALPAPVTAVVFSHDNRWLATALQDATIVVWELDAVETKH